MFHDPTVIVYQGMSRLASVQHLCMEAFPLPSREAAPGERERERLVM